jgi:RNA polymerase sigma factor (sigma-70 family)
LFWNVGFVRPFALIVPAESAFPMVDNFDDNELIVLRPALVCFARTFVKTPTDADDLVQETMLRALSYRHQFRAGTRLKSWLFTIMRNAFYNEALRVRREHPGIDACVADERSLAPSQDHVMALRELHARINALPPAFRDTLMLVASGESCEYVAATEGCAVGTVKSRVSRARRMIADGG